MLKNYRKILLTLGLLPASLNLMANELSDVNVAFNVSSTELKSAFQIQKPITKKPASKNPYHKKSTTNASPTELKNSWQVSSINAPTLWSYNILGGKVKIAELDTGIYLHNELNGRVLSGYDFVNNIKIAANSSSDDNGHGTHVAGIISANINNNAGTYDVVGVAPQALLIPIKVLDSDGSGSLYNLVRGLDYSISAGAHISSMSLGWEGDEGDAAVASALQRTVSAGQLIVIAAGNSGLANPGWPARYAKETFANGQMIAVGAVDANNLMPSWSNKAGDTANFYLVAPGVDILSTYKNSKTSYAFMSGTSMATPVVSGAAALLKQGWNLSAQQIATILFTTATDLGTPGVDSTYGWGLLNLQKAMSPIGNPTFPTLTSNGITLKSNLPILNSASLTPSAYKMAFANANLKIAGLDDFGRDFIYDFSSLYATKTNNDLMLSQVFNSMSANSSIREYKTKDSKITIGQIDTNTFNLTNPFDDQTTITSLFYSKQLHDGQLMAFGMNTNTNHFSGFVDTPFENSGFMSRRAFDNPYLGFNGYQNFMAYAYPLTSNWDISAGVVNNFDSFSKQAVNINQMYRPAQPSLNAGLMELSNKTQNNKLTISVGSVFEQGGMLGGSAGTLFGVTETSNTVFLSLKNATKLAKDTWFAASLNHGLTLKNGNQGSLVTSTGNIQSQSWSIGLLSDNVFLENDRLGFAISQPLAVKSGNINFTAPTGLDYDTGMMKFENRSISMTSASLERDFEMTYKVPTSRNANLSLSALYRMNPENNPMNSDQGLLTVFWQSWF